MTEEWRSVPGFYPFYEVSNLGRVRSLYVGRILKQGTDSNGYPIVMLTKGGKRQPFTVHRLVCRAFHGEPKGIWNEAAHLDGDRKNARADNLRWVNKVENHHHMRAHGTHPAGERHGAAKLTVEQVREIKAEKGFRINAQLGRKYGVHKDTIGMIRRGVTWREGAEAEGQQRGPCEDTASPNPSPHQDHPK